VIARRRAQSHRHLVERELVKAGVDRPGRVEEHEDPAGPRDGREPLLLAGRADDELTIASGARGSTGTPRTTAADGSRGERRAGGRREPEGRPAHRAHLGEPEVLEALQRRCRAGRDDEPIGDHVALVLERAPATPVPAEPPPRTGPQGSWPARLEGGEEALDQSAVVDAVVAREQEAPRRPPARVGSSRSTSSALSDSNLDAGGAGEPGEARGLPRVALAVPDEQRSDRGVANVDGTCGLHATRERGPMAAAAPRSSSSASSPGATSAARESIPAAAHDAAVAGVGSTSVQAIEASASSKATAIPMTPAPSTTTEGLGAVPTGQDYGRSVRRPSAPDVPASGRRAAQNGLPAPRLSKSWVERGVVVGESATRSTNRDVPVGTLFGRTRVPPRREAHRCQNAATTT